MAIPQARTFDAAVAAGRPLRVLFVPQWYPVVDSGEPRAAGTFCREHVRAAALFDRVAVLVFTPRLQRWPTLHWKRIEDHGVPTFYATYGLSPVPKTTLPFFHWNLRRALRRVIEEWGIPDVVHTQDDYAYYVMKAFPRSDIPFVMSQHWTGLMERSLTGRAIQRWRWAFRRAARVFPSDRFAAREYGRYGLEAAVTWLPNALDTDIFRPPRDSQRAPWIVHASGFTAAKRFPDIVQAFADVCRTHPDAVLHVAGDGHDRPEMERLATKALGPQNVHFHGFLTKPKLAELLRRAAGFVLASDAETFGCVLMEAMACGCPVVTTRVGGIAAVVREGEGLFVDVGNVEQLAAGMRRVLDGTHGLDTGRIAWETGQRFSHAAVGRILHHEHALVSRGGGQTCAG